MAMNQQTWGLRARGRTGIQLHAFVREGFTVQMFLNLFNLFIANI